VNVVLARGLRTVAILATLVMLLSFALFALDQASGASQQARAQVDAGGAQPAGPAVPKPGLDHRVRRAIDGASDGLGAPFAAVAPGQDSSWARHLFVLLGGLLAYGFGVGALARTAGLSRLHAHEHEVHAHL
jgi:hypothetical protein